MQTCEKDKEMVTPATENSLAEALKGRTLVLASTSPRRIEFFEKLGVPFLARTGDVREHYPDTLTDGREIVQYLSRLKARAAGPLAPQEIIVGADTLVWADGRPLGKPRDEQEAEATLRALSGRTHEVLTGVTLRSVTDEESFCCATRVTFLPIDPQDIRYYVSRFSPLDKAGAYAIQEWIGETHIASIEGSYHNVVGLPTAQLYQRLKKFAARG